MIGDERAADNAFCLQGIATTERAIGGAALYAAPDRGSDQRRNGTQDVNDPVYGPATRGQSLEGSFTSWVPSVVVSRSVGGISVPQIFVKIWVEIGAF
jgi:hypothetical protein